MNIFKPIHEGQAKKFVFFMLFLFSLSALLLQGCGSSPKNHGLNPKKPQEITIWNYYNGAQAVAFEKAVSEFNNTEGMEKGIIVTVQSKASVEDLSQALSDSANEVVGAEAMPDIFQCYSNLAVVLDNKGLLADLDQYADKSDREKYKDSYIQDGMIHGAWKLFPIAKGTEILALNQTDWDIFAAETGASLDSLSTWEGIARVSEAYYQWSKGRSFFGRDAFANYILVGSKQLEHEIFQIDKNGVTVHLDKETMRRLWDNFYVPYVKGYYKHTGRYRSDDVKIGEILCCVCSISGMTYFPREVTFQSNDPYPIETLILPVPNFEGTKPYAVLQGASMAVSKSDERREYASVVFLTWFTQPENNIPFASESGYLPVTEEASSYEAIEKELSQSKTPATSVQMDTLKVSLQETKDYTLYASEGFEQGEDARNLLGSSMLDLAVSNREAVTAAISNGSSEKEALAPYLTDACFESWYNNLYSQLTTICQ